MSFIVCNVDRDELERQNPELPLYPGKINQWIVAVKASPSGESVKQAIAMLFYPFSGIIPLETTGFTPPVRDLALTSWQVGPPTSLSGAMATLRGFPSEALPKDRIYAAIRFQYMGTEPSLSPWPWRGRGFVIRCPEDVIGGVLAVMPPFEPPKESETPGPLDRIIGAPLTGAARDIALYAKIIGGAAVAVLLFNLYQWTKSPRRS